MSSIRFDTLEPLYARGEAMQTVGRTAWLGRACRRSRPSRRQPARC